MTGGPNSCYEENSPTRSRKSCLSLGIPVLGLCYGAQLMMHELGGKVVTSLMYGEYGKTEVSVHKYPANGVMFKDLPCRIEYAG